MGPTDDFDRLLEHASWVRALGVRLAGASDGEDVAQEAWLVALASGDGVRAPTAWLRGVLRKLTSERRRGAARRARREAAAARPEAVPGPDELVAEAELTRELIRAVTELEEPFRSTVLLRYSRGLEPDEIARQEGVPAATVRTRLHRAHEKLRARLDRTHGGRAAWALAFASGGVRPVGEALTITGGALLGMNAKLVGGAAVVALIGMAWLDRGERATEGGDGAERTNAVVLAPAEGAPSPEPEPAVARPEREPVAPPSLSRADSSDAPPCALYGRVLDEAGAPIVPWAPLVSLTDAAGKRVNTKVADDGSYCFSELAPGTRRLNVGAVGYRDHEEDLEFTGEPPSLQRDFVLRRAVRLSVRLVTESGEVLREALKARTEVWHDDSIYPFPVATFESPGTEIPAALHHGNDRIGVGSLWDYGPFREAAGRDSAGVLVLSVDLPVFVSLTQGSQVLETQFVEEEREVVFVVDPDALLARRGKVRAQMVAESGAAVAGRIELEPSNQFHEALLGSWEQALAPGRYTALFAAPGHASTARSFQLAAGQEVDLGEVLMTAERTIEGRISDEAGRPVEARLRVGKVDANGRVTFPDFVLHSSDEEGAYRIEGLADGEYVLRTVGDDEVTFPASDEPPTTWVCGNVPIHLRGASVQGFDIRLVRAGILVLQGAETLPSEARFTLLDARGDELRATRHYPGFVPRFVLPPGAYTLVVRDAQGTELLRRTLEVGAEPCEVDLAR